MHVGKQFDQNVTKSKKYVPENTNEYSTIITLAYAVSGEDFD